MAGNQTTAAEILFINFIFHSSLPKTLRNSMGHNSTPAGGCSDKPHTSPSRPLTEKGFPRNWGFSTTTRRTHALAIRSYLVPTALTTPTTRPLHHSTPCSGCFAPARGKIGDIREQHTSDWRTILLQLRQEPTKTDLVLDHAPPHLYLHLDRGRAHHTNIRATARITPRARTRATSGAVRARLTFPKDIALGTSTLRRYCLPPRTTSTAHLLRSPSSSHTSGAEDFI